jgi:prephenate dehydratase
MTSKKIAYLGIPGSFSHNAATRYFSDQETFLSYPGFSKVFEAVSSGSCAAGLVPLENSLAGSIYENYDLLRSASLSIVGEIALQIEHDLCVYSTTASLPTPEQITHLYSHPKALEQVSGFINKYPGLTLISTSDTASAALEVAKLKLPGHAALCSRAAAALYGLRVVQENLEDDRLNFTRFAVLSREAPLNLNHNKCSLLLILPHIPKALFKTLEVIVSVAQNTTKIESRPIPGKPFEYVFYIDFEFEASERTNVEAMLERLRETVAELKILGFYQSYQET